MVSNSLYDLLVSSLTLLYAAQREMLRVLPRVISEVSCAELREVLLSYIGEIETRVERLEAAARVLSFPMASGANSGVNGLIRDLTKIAKRRGEIGVVDVALMAALRQIEFCEISSYETARSIAEVLGEGEVSQLLEENLREEEGMERFLTVLSEELIDDHGSRRV